MKQKGDRLDTSLRLKIVRAGTEESVTLAELLDKPLVVSIYMKNNTGSCDRQNDSLIAHADAIAAKGYHLLALSRDSCKSHAGYAAKKGIPYLLASDPDDAFAQAVDAIIEKSMYGKKYLGPARAAFIIGRDGTLLDVIEKVDPKRHGEELLERL